MFPQIVCQTVSFGVVKISKVCITQKTFGYIQNYHDKKIQEEKDDLAKDSLCNALTLVHLKDLSLEVLLGRARVVHLTLVLTHHLEYNDFTTIIEHII